MPLTLHEIETDSGKLGQSLSHFLFLCNLWIKVNINYYKLFNYNKIVILRKKKLLKTIALITDHCYYPFHIFCIPYLPMLVMQIA